MLTGDTSPSHLCPRCCEIKQNSLVPSIISLRARPAPLCLEQGHACCATGTGLMAECPSSHAGEQRKHSRETSVPPKVTFCQQSHSRTFLSHSHDPWGAAGPGKGCEHSRAGIQAEQARAVLQQALEPRGAAGTSRHGRGQPAVCHVARRN